MFDPKRDAGTVDWESSDIGTVARGLGLTVRDVNICCFDVLPRSGTYFELKSVDGATLANRELASERSKLNGLLAGAASTYTVY